MVNECRKCSSVLPKTFGYQKGDFNFRFDIADVFPNRPQLVAPYATAVSFWSYVESWYAHIHFTLKLDTTLEDLVRFQDQRNSKRHRTEVLKSAKAVLPDERLKLFEEALEVAVQPGPQRNDLVHGIAMVTDAYPDALLILRPEHVQKLMRQTFGELMRTNQIPESMSKDGADCMSHALIYGLPELECLMARIKRSERLMFHLWQMSVQTSDAAAQFGEQAIRSLLGMSAFVPAERSKQG